MSLCSFGVHKLSAVDEFYSEIDCRTRWSEELPNRENEKLNRIELNLTELNWIITN